MKKVFRRSEKGYTQNSLQGECGRKLNGIESESSHLTAGAVAEADSQMKRTAHKSCMVGGEETK